MIISDLLVLVCIDISKYICSVQKVLILIRSCVYYCNDSSV